MFTVAGILGISSLLQTVVGFGAGLLGIPLLLLAGFSPVQAVAVVTVTSIIQSAIGSWKLRESIRFSDTQRPILIRLLMLLDKFKLFIKFGRRLQLILRLQVVLIVIYRIFCHM